MDRLNKKAPLEHNSINDELNTAISDLKKLECIKERPVFVKALDGLEKRLKDKTFRIAVVGEFSSGKSTFINAIIGRDVLTHAVTETTATITYIYNVQKKDKRLNTCVINFTDGKSQNITDISEISKYTTAQSNIDVVSKIASVEVYVNFLNTDVPLVIVDTPGLNGIASGHKNITLNEIGKAHACIYIVSRRGITSSDSDFIRILAEQQSEFIFVQNFIDEIKEDEGETVENKLEKLGSDLNEYLQDLDINISVCGVSALKALVGKDDTIEYLYSSDADEVTPQRRTQIYKESGFDSFEIILSQMIDSGRYLNVISQSVCQSIESIVVSLLPGMKQQLEDEKAILQKDKATSAAEIAQKRIEHINSTRGKSEEKLNNFVISNSKDLIRNVSGFANSGLNKIYDDVCADIEKKISTYDDYEMLSFQSGGKVSNVFSSPVNVHVQNDIVAEVNRAISNGFNDIYSSALLRAAEYSGVVERSSNYNVSINDKFKGMDKTQEVDYDARIARTESERQRKRREQESYSNDAESARRDLKNLSSEEVDALERDNATLRAKLQGLGSRPDVEIIKVKKTRKVERGGGIIGLFQKIGDWFTGGEYETYFETREDHSKQDKWKNEFNELNARISKNERELDSQRSLYEMQRNKIQQRIANSSAQSAQAKHSVDILSKKIEQLEFEKKTATTQLKREYCENIRKQLKQQFAEVLIEDNDNSVKNRLYEYINNICEKNRDTVKALAREQLNLGFDDTIRRLTKIISNNDQRIQEALSLSEKETEKLDETLNLIKKMEESL